MKNRIKIELSIKSVLKFISKLNDCGDCIEWTGGFKNDYGVFYNKGKNIYSHRVAYSIANGSIDDNLVIDHTCMNKKCVNPEHLRQVTQTINALENNNGIFAKNSRKSYCINGHEFSIKNTRFRTRNNRKSRYCFECSRIKNEARKNKKL